MNKSALVLSLVFVAGAAFAGETKAPAAPKTTEKTVATTTVEKTPAVKTHEVAVEVVSVDMTAKTITIKGEKDNKTVPVDEKALASVKDLKSGDKVTVICRDNEKGEHQAVAGVKVAAPAAPTAEKK